MEKHKAKMARKKAARDKEYAYTQLVRDKVKEIFQSNEEATAKLVTNAHKRVWKNMEMAYFLLALGRPRSWVKRTLGINNTIFQRVNELNSN